MFLLLNAKQIPEIQNFSNFQNLELLNYSLFLHRNFTDNENYLYRHELQSAHYGA